MDRSSWKLECSSWRQQYVGAAAPRRASPEPGMIRDRARAADIYSKIYTSKRARASRYMYNDLHGAHARPPAGQCGTCALDADGRSPRVRNVRAGSQAK